jgi:hypothetical protein
MITRRGFFGLAAGTVAATVIAEQIAKTIFLPPRCGWFHTPLRIREIRQYSINDDTYPMRYDAKWMLPNGGFAQWHVQFDPISAMKSMQDPGILDIQRQTAFETLERIRRKHGYSNLRQGDLSLPGGVEHARIIEL